MSTSRSFGQFARRVGLRAQNLGRRTEEQIRKAALAADAAVVMSTPVDTGHARRNWIASVGVPASIELMETDPAGGETIQQGAAVISTWKLGQGSIFLTNSVPYILLLEDGWSMQAPRGMTVHAIRAAQSVLKNAKLLGP